MTGIELWFISLPIIIVLLGIYSELHKMNKTKER